MIFIEDRRGGIEILVLNSYFLVNANARQS